MAIGPVVVARNQDERMADARELLLARFEPGVGAGPASRGDVADVYHESQFFGVQLVDQAVQLRHFKTGIGRIAHQAERDALVGGDRQGQRATGEKNDGCDEQRAQAVSPVRDQVCFRSMGNRQVQSTINDGSP